MSCENLEQIEQIQSELKTTQTLNSELNREEQISSSLGIINVITSNMVYMKKISILDWKEANNKFVYTLYYDEHLLSNPCVIKFDVKNGDIYENAIISYTVDKDYNIIIQLDVKVEAIIKIEGEI